MFSTIFKPSNHPNIFATGVHLQNILTHSSSMVDFAALLPTARADRALVQTCSTKYLHLKKPIKDICTCKNMLNPNICICTHLVTNICKNLQKIAKICTCKNMFDSNICICTNMVTNICTYTNLVTNICTRYNLKQQSTQI